MHTIIINKPVSEVADGLVLGNGDLSVSCYQKQGKLVFQFGKNDFWDNRLDFSRNPKPAHIQELRDAIDKYGLSVDGVTGEVKGKTELPDRLKEVVRNLPSHRDEAPSPKPGPVFYLHYPADWTDCTLQQTLEIERGLLRIELRHYDGAELCVEAVIHPEYNRLSVRWKLTGWNKENLYGGWFFGLPEIPPVYGTLFRDEELSLEEMNRREFLEHGNNYFCNRNAMFPKASVELQDGVLCQTLGSGKKLFSAMKHAPVQRVEEYAKVLRAYAQIDATEGEFQVTLSTQSAENARELLQAGSWEKDLPAAEQAAEMFWSRSAVSFSDSLLEDTWYAAIHAKRCILRRGTVPPGLFFPSALQDYSMWRGDYHLNYNYQSIFLGDYETNHPETGDAYFDGIQFLMRLGEKISRDYYGIDGGCFIQLSGFPFDTEDDYYGSLPLGRMAYMTGWVAAYFHRRWLYTQALDFLRKTGYPALRKFAVFYAGFLQKGEDGFYHSFPSNQGESEFSREKAYDQTQVLHHACYALQAAAETATVLGVDAEDRILWQEIAKKLPKCEEIREKKIAPEYAAFDGHVHKKGEIPDFLTVGNRFHDWYFGQMPYKLSVYLRTQVWNTETWFDGIHNTLKRWQQPNHLIRAMSMATHGIRPAWTESLGIAGALTDLLILSDGGLIRLFPGIPQNQSASFITLRTENAFLVSAEKNEDCVSQIVVKSERGNPCRIQNPWPGKDVLLNGQTILSGSKLCFDTIAGQEYHLAQVI